MASLVISPLFLLTVQGWMTRIIVVCALLGVAVCAQAKKQPKVLHPTCPISHQAAWALVLPLLSVMASQLLGLGHGTPLMASSFDSPAHLLLGVLVLMAMPYTHARLLESLTLTFPLALFLALVAILIQPGETWGLSRVYSTALDPLAFGSLALTFGLMSLVSITQHRHQTPVLILYKMVGFGLGVYLSIISGSRTGWLAAPLVAFIWAYAERNRLTWRIKCLVISGVLLTLGLAYQTNDIIQKRVDLATQEIVEYEWGSKKPNPVSSVGDRISFIRIAVFLMSKKPLSGWGEDGSWKQVMNHPDLSFAHVQTKAMALKAGFHNEITAKMVQSGVWGLVSSVLMFGVPAFIFYHALHSNKAEQRHVALLGAVFLSCQFVSSLSMELTNLRYAASFYGLMIAIFCGQLAYYVNQDRFNTTQDITR
jgi:O-antigen ligase